MDLRNNRHIWLPVVLLIYAGFMAWQGRDILLIQHDYVRYFGTLALELGVITLLTIFLRKRIKLKNEREQK